MSSYLPSFFVTPFLKADLRSNTPSPSVLETESVQGNIAYLMFREEAFGYQQSAEQR